MKSYVLDDPHTCGILQMTEQYIRKYKILLKEIKDSNK